MKILGDIVAALRQYIVTAPLSFLFFILGATLALLGLTQGVRWLVADESLRVWAIVFSIACLGTAVLLYLIAARSVSVTEPPDVTAVGEQPATTDASPCGSMAMHLLSPRQRKLLRMVEDAASTGSSISQDDLQRGMELGPSETYYRLEQLIFLGFIKRRREMRSTSPTWTGESYWTYELSPEYRDRMRLGRGS